MHFPDRPSSLCYLSLRHTKIGDEPLYAFKGTSFKEFDVCETLVSGAELCYIISRNSKLHVLNACPLLSSGRLLGLDIGSLLEVTNYFLFPSRGTEEENKADADGVNYQFEMMRCLREGDKCISKI